MLHRARELLIGQRTALINALRGHFAEFGIVVAQGAATRANWSQGSWKRNTDLPRHGPDALQRLAVDVAC